VWGKALRIGFGLLFIIIIILCVVSLATRNLSLHSIIKNTVVIVMCFGFIPFLVNQRVSWFISLPFLIISGIYFIYDIFYNALSHFSLSIVIHDVIYIFACGYVVKEVGKFNLSSRNPT